MQFVTNENGEKTAVVLPIGQYQKLIEDLDDLTVIAERRDEPSISHAEMIAELKRDEAVVESGNATMGPLKQSAATLRIMGDDLIPDEITRLLGATPTCAQKKGDEIVGKKTGHVRIARTGLWRLQASKREPADLDGQVEEILSQMTDDLSIWESITTRYRADLFCGLFMDDSNEGITISARALADLGNRGIELGLDIYSGDLPQRITELEVQK